MHALDEKQHLRRQTLPWIGSFITECKNPKLKMGKVNVIHGYKICNCNGYIVEELLQLICGFEISNNANVLLKYGKRWVKTRKLPTRPTHDAAQ